MTVSKRWDCVDWLESIKAPLSRWGQSSPAVLTVFIHMSPLSLSLLKQMLLFVWEHFPTPTPPHPTPDHKNMFGPCTEQAKSSRVNAPRSTPQLRISRKLSRQTCHYPHSSVGRTVRCALHCTPEFLRGIEHQGSIVTGYYALNWLSLSLSHCPTSPSVCLPNKLLLLKSLVRLSPNKL